MTNYFLIFGAKFHDSVNLYINVSVLICHPWNGLLVKLGNNFTCVLFGQLAREIILNFYSSPFDYTYKLDL